MVLAALSWAVFAVLSTLVMRPFVRLSASSPEAIAYGVTYGRIVCIGSLGTFLEGIWSKVHQAGCNMKLPMLAQVTGAVINVVLDLLLIFGVGGLPAMGAACFILLPGALIGIFSRSAEVLAIGRIAFPTIGASFPSAAFSLIMPTFFQAIGCGGRSLAVTLTRQILFLVPLLYLMPVVLPQLFPQFTGLDALYFAAPVADFLSIFTTAVFVAWEMARLRRLSAMYA